MHVSWCIFILHSRFSSSANAHDMRLQSRDSRMNWEADFCSVIVVPVITVCYEAWSFVLLLLSLHYIISNIFNILCNSC